MEKLVWRLFHVFPHERQRALCMALLAFLWSLGAYCTQTLFDGFFLEHVGAAALPKAYFITALAACCIAGLLWRLLKRFAPITVFFTAMAIMALVCMAGAVGFYLGLFDTTSQWLWMGAKVTTSVLVIVLCTCFWACCDRIYGLSDATRLYGLFNAAVFGGDMVGGGLISLGLRTFHIPGMLLITGTVLVLACFFLRGQVNSWPVHKLPTGPEGNYPALSRGKFWKTVVASPFTLWLIVAYMLVQLLCVVTQFNYMEEFGNHFHRTEGELTAFLGQCTFFISFVNIFVNLFVYGRVVQRLGINNIILACPIFFVATFLSWTVTDVLLVAICGLVAVKGLSETIDENNFNVLVNAVPSHLKEQIRVTGSVFEPFGMLVSSVVLMVGSAHSRWLGLIVACITLAVIALLRTSFRKEPAMQSASNPAPASSPTP
jgi:ATP/ADP translocase